MKNHTGIIKTHRQHIRRGGSLWQTLSAFVLAAFFGTSTGFAGIKVESAQDGSWSNSATWAEPQEYLLNFYTINAGHTVTFEANQPEEPTNALILVYGHLVLEAGSSLSTSFLSIANTVNDDNEWSLARLTLGSGATLSSISVFQFLGTIEMAAGSHISQPSGSITNGIYGWQNLIFDGNGQEGANAWISTPALAMISLAEIADPDTNLLPGFTGPWNNIELNGFGEGTWSLISGISTLIDYSTMNEGGEDARGTIDLSLLNMITLSGDSVANAKAELGMVFDEATDTYTLSVTISAVPEPAGYATLAGLALLAWVAMRRYRGVRR
ncbi:MAG: hypothetical protein LBK99_22355 [Opitutaceae bacterium]|jgi:hypothetical protein|nr:hypothetical protein [Opitutaceae bacterium]